MTGYTCTGLTPDICSETCGDSTVTFTEQCDDTNSSPNDGCSSTCQEELGWDCSTGTCVEICGDGLIVGGENCDDGN